MSASTSPQSVTRVIHILEALCASAEPLSLAQLSRALDAPKSSVAALLRGLADADFVERINESYRLGPAAFSLGSAVLETRRQLSSSDQVRAGMRRLADHTGETVLFAVRDGGAETMTYVEVIESPNAVRFAVSAGDRRPLYCTSGGRAFLAGLSDAELSQYLKRVKLRSLTSHTETDKRRLAKAINSARKAGVAQTVDQTADGVTGTAALVRDAAGQALGALIVAAPTARLHDHGAGLARRVREEAAMISRSLGFRKP